jgi:hypothetical protein
MTIYVHGAGAEVEGRICVRFLLFQMAVLHNKPKVSTKPGLTLFFFKKQNRAGSQMQRPSVMRYQIKLFRLLSPNYY